MLNNKELFYLFLKHSGVVINRYEQLMESITKHNDKESNNKDFSLAFDNAAKKIEQTIHYYGKSFPNYMFYLGEEGWEKYGVFSFLELYKETNWNLTLIEKYKDAIVWPLLLEFGNFKFEECLLREYDKYIPWVEYSDVGEKQYSAFSKYDLAKHGKTLSNFKNIGKLSTDFILSHISVIDLVALYETGEFEMSPILAKTFYKIALDEDLKEGPIDVKMTGDDPFDVKGWYVSEQYRHRDRFIETIIKNPRIYVPFETIWYMAIVLSVHDWEKLLCLVEMSPKRLLAFYRLNNRAIDIFIESDFSTRRKIISMIMQEKELFQALGLNYIKRLYQGRDRRALSDPKFDGIWKNDRHGYLPYSYDFSVELIRNNIDNLNKQVYEYFIDMHRRPDTNYCYYKRVTGWDMLAKQESVLLTYDICRYLMSINIKTGGSYTLEDDNYLTDDIPNYDINGLKLFQFRDVKDEKEFNKIADDTELIEFFLENRDCFVSDKRINIIDKIILEFFKDFSFEKFKDIVFTKCFSKVSTNTSKSGSRPTARRRR